MQATAAIPTGANIIRGLMSEAAVQRNLELIQAHHAQYKLPKIIEIIPGRKHADFTARMVDGAGIVDVPIEVKSSDYCASIFKKKCRRYGWGQIPTVVARPVERVMEYSMDLIERLVDLLKEGFKFFRRRLCNQIASRRNPALKKKRFIRESFRPVVRINAVRPAPC